MSGFFSPQNADKVGAGLARGLCACGSQQRQNEAGRDGGVCSTMISGMRP